MTSHAALATAVRVIVKWLNANNGCGDHEITLRILKVFEEAGEVASARIDNLGQNPRKRSAQSSRDIADELADVIVTAAVAIESLGFSHVAVLAAKCGKLVDRIEAL